MTTLPRLMSPLDGTTGISRPQPELRRGARPPSPRDFGLTPDAYDDLKRPPLMRLNGFGARLAVSIKRFLWRIAAWLLLTALLVTLGLSVYDLMTLGRIDIGRLVPAKIYWMFLGLWLAVSTVTTLYLRLIGGLGKELEAAELGLLKLLRPSYRRLQAYERAVDAYEREQI